MTLRPTHSRPAIAWALAALATLGGCQSLPEPGRAARQASATPAQGEPSPATVSLQGQMSVKLEAFQDLPARGMSFGFFFSGHAQEGELDLMTPLGSQVAHLHWQPARVELVDADGPHLYGSIAELSQKALGEALPLDTLIHWMQGHPDPTQPSVAGSTAGGFVQLGWEIDLSQRADQRIIATRTATPLVRGVRIKVYLDR